MQNGQQNDRPLTVYRSPQNLPSEASSKFATLTNQKLNPALEADAKNMFDKMRHDPQVELIGQEAWENGHTVYVLRSQQEIKLLVENEITHPMAQVTFYFDLETYQPLGNRVTMEKDGNEVLISSQRILLDEILPADSSIIWNLGDLRGLNIVDDLDHEHNTSGIIALNVISIEDLASKTDSPIYSRQSQMVFPRKSAFC